MKKYIIILITIFILVMVILSAYFLLKPKPTSLEIKLGAITYNSVNWVKPTTDAGWAEDVKKENFDIKSTGVLETMIASHTEKLYKEIEAFKKYQECPECIFYEAKENMRNAYPDMSDTEVDAEARAQANTEIAQRQWSIEKLKQSVERMNKEVELRDNGFVVVEGEKRGLFGSTVPLDRIRHINN